MPLNFQLSAISSSVLMANWTPPSSPNGIVTGYTVYCTVSQNQTYPEQVPTGGSTYTVLNVTSQTSVYLRGLLPFTFYQCYVTANTTVGEGRLSTTVLSQTGETGTDHSMITCIYMLCIHHVPGQNYPGNYCMSLCILLPCIDFYYKYW